MDGPLLTGGRRTDGAPTVGASESCLPKLLGDSLGFRLEQYRGLVTSTTEKTPGLSCHEPHRLSSTGYKNTWT